MMLDCVYPFVHILNPLPPQANEILHHKLTLNGYLAEFTGQSMETITADTDRDFFMGAQEAVEYGLVDAVVNRQVLALG